MAGADAVQLRHTPGQIVKRLAICLLIRDGFDDAFELFARLRSPGGPAWPIEISWSPPRLNTCPFASWDDACSAIIAPTTSVDMAEAVASACHRRTPADGFPAKAAVTNRGSTMPYIPTCRGTYGVEQPNDRHRQTKLLEDTPAREIHQSPWHTHSTIGCDASGPSPHHPLR